MKILKIVKKLYPFDYSVAGEGNDRSRRGGKAYGSETGGYHGAK